MQALVVQEREITVREDTLASLVDAFISSLDVAAGSRQTYSRQLRQFILWLQETGRADRLSTMSRQDILEYKDYLLSTRSSLTASGYLTVVRKLYAWLEGEKIYPNIARDVQLPKKAQGFRKDCLTAGQLRQALDAMDRDRLEGMRDYAAFNLMARTGLRTVELARAVVGDLRQESGEPVLWIQGKGRTEKDALVLLMDEALEPIRQYLSARGPLSDEEPLFCSHSDRNKGQALTTRSLSRIVKEALRRIGLDDKRLSAHSLRHTAISLSIRDGASLEQAQAMARHASPVTTMIYFHNIDRLEHAAERHIHF